MVALCSPIFRLGGWFWDKLWIISTGKRGKEHDLTNTGLAGCDRSSRKAGKPKSQVETNRGSRAGSCRVLLVDGPSGPEEDSRGERVRPQGCFWQGAGAAIDAAPRAGPYSFRRERDAASRAGRVGIWAGALLERREGEDASLTGRRRRWAGLTLYDPNGKLRASLHDGSLEVSDKEGFQTKIGTTDLVTPRTGETHKTSAASMILFDKDRKVLWQAP